MSAKLDARKSGSFKIGGDIAVWLEMLRAILCRAVGLQPMP
jgi:hypothetical protein